MSKSDEIRRMRELQHAQRERAASGQPPTSGPAQVPARPAPPPSEPEAEAEPVTRSAHGADEKGKCSGCGKVRALVNGTVAMHQKGLGKMCPGSRKEPV